MRLDKYLADVLKISRQNAKKLIKDKEVLVNDNIVSNINIIIDEKKDCVIVNNQMLQYQKYIYLMMNKPKGYLSATFDNSNPTIIELVPQQFNFKDLSIVGRLDKDTAGLILLSNDGAFIHNITSPKKHISKKYYVEYSGVLLSDAVSYVENGIEIDDYKTLPGKLELIGSNKAYITIYEGKFHQVKKMFEKLNTKVEYLKRVQIGSLQLGDLKIGEVKELTLDELEKIKE
ncbi:MAG: pseudouridine synthase [Bacilli bacterium]|nr:pseudouridine synthase [Bacilli bacterium]